MSLNVWFLQKGTEGQKERREREIVHIKKGAGMCCVHVPTSGRECKHTQHVPKNGRRSRDGCAEGKETDEKRNGDVLCTCSNYLQGM